MTVTIKSVRHRAALVYAMAGWPVFACRVNAKQPAFTRSFKEATTSMLQIDQWWDAADYNIGMCPDHIGHLVFDVEKDGAEEWAAIFPIGTPTDMVSRTPNGGWHYWFKGQGKCTVKKIAPHIDTRGEGGYVLLPPSVVDGRPYTWM